MSRAIALFTILLPQLAALAGEKRVIARGLPAPTGLTVGADNRIYVAVTKSGDDSTEGAVVVVERPGSATFPREGLRPAPFAVGFDHPTSIVPWLGNLLVADRSQIWRVDRSGKRTVHIAASDFPLPESGLKNLTVDESGHLYVTTEGGDIYSIAGKGKVSIIAADKFKKPNGILMDGMSHLLVADADMGVNRYRLSDGELTRVADGSFAALAWDWRGRLYLAGADGRLFVRPRPGAKPVLLSEGLGEIGGICLTPDGAEVLVTNRRAGTLWSVPADIPASRATRRRFLSAPRSHFRIWFGPVGSQSIRPVDRRHCGHSY